MFDLVNFIIEKLFAAGVNAEGSKKLSKRILHSTVILLLLIFLFSVIVLFALVGFAMLQSPKSVAEIFAGVALIGLDAFITALYMYLLIRIVQEKYEILMYPAMLAFPLFVLFKLLLKIYPSK